MSRFDTLLAIFIAAIWGFNFVVIKVGIDAFPPLLFSALRFLLAAFPLVFFLKKPDVNWGIILGIGCVLGIIKFSLLFLGMDIGLSAGLASIVVQSQAFFTVLLAFLLFQEKLSRQHMMGVFVAFTGIFLIGFTVDREVTVLGLILVVLAGLAWGVSNLFMKKAGAIKMLNLMVWISLIPPIPLFLLSLYFEGQDQIVTAFENLDIKGWGAVIYIAFIATVFAYAVWGRLIHQYGAASIAPFGLLVPIFGMLSSSLFLNEEFGPLRLSAAVLVFTGLTLIIWKKPKLAFLRLGKEVR